jgi:hypothetical protein
MHATSIVRAWSRTIASEQGKGSSEQGKGSSVQVVLSTLERHREQENISEEPFAMTPSTIQEAVVALVLGFFVLAKRSQQLPCRPLCKHPPKLPSVETSYKRSEQGDQRLESVHKFSHEKKIIGPSKLELSFRIPEFDRK